MDEATQKGLATRQRCWEARNEKRRLKALEEEAKAAKIKACLLYTSGKRHSAIYASMGRDLSEFI